MPLFKLQNCRCSFKNEQPAVKLVVINSIIKNTILTNKTIKRTVSLLKLSRNPIFSNRVLKCFMRSLNDVTDKVKIAQTNWMLS